MVDRIFFDSPEMVRKLTATADAMMARHDIEPVYRLGQLIRMIAANPSDFDKNCQINIEWVASRLMDDLAKLKPDDPGTHAVPIALIYRFLVEYDMSVQNDMSMEVRSFMSKVEASVETLTEEARTNVQYARQSMPVAMLKKMLNSNDFGNLRNVSAVASSVDQRIIDWEGQLKKSEANANRLGTILEKQTSAFNFVGLYDGFADLSKNIVGELHSARIGIAIFGVLVLLPGMFNLWVVVHQNFSTITTYKLLAAGVGTLTLTLLFLYFFRIALRKSDSCRAQLMQVRLRMSLCKFIQSYADYSKGIRENNPDALSKFEALIFSGIVGTEDKMPSTFDGIEQLSALAKSIRGNG